MSAPDYRAAPIAGTRWRRANHIEAFNPFGGVRMIRFDEEDRTVLDTGESFGEPAGSVEQALVDPATCFALRDPSTGQPTGQTMSHGELYVALWSLYIGLAEARDVEQNP